jgi:hypothetical protein
MNDRGFTRIAQGAICMVASILCALPAQLHAAPAANAGKTRTYYVAADEV